MAGTVTLITSALQGDIIDRTADVPGGSPTDVQIQLVSPGFTSDPTKEIDFVVLESFDGGGHYDPASGSPFNFKGGFPPKAGGNPTLQFSFDGRARKVKVTARPTINAVSAPFTWGVTATLL